MMILPKELEVEIKEKLRYVSKPFDLIPIWRMAGKNMHPIDARDCFSCYRRYANPPEAFFEHLIRFSVEEKKMMRRIDESTDPREIMEIGRRLGMNLDMKTAEDFAEHHKQYVENIKEDGKDNSVQATEDTLVKWMDTRDKQEFITIGMELDSDATENEMAELFDKLRIEHHR